MKTVHIVVEVENGIQTAHAYSTSEKAWSAFTEMSNDAGLLVLGMGNVAKQLSRWPSSTLAMAERNNYQLYLLEMPVF